MEKFTKTVTVISVLFFAVAIALIIVTLGLTLEYRRETQEPWVLQSYGNSVALYNGDEIVEVYGTIVLDTLPEEDKRMLDNGLSFLTKEEAVSAIEDYDG